MPAQTAAQTLDDVRDAMKINYFDDKRADRRAGALNTER